MKCIVSKDGTIDRVHDYLADARVKSGDWMFAPKSKWKNQIYGLYDKIRKQFPANVEGSPEFNKANADALKADEKIKKAEKEQRKREHRLNKINK